MSRSKRFNVVTMILNIIIVILVVYGIFIMQFPSQLAWAKTGNLESTGVGMFKFFTSDSNFLMAIIAAIMIPFNIKKLKDENYQMPRWMSVLYFAGTATVALTFLVVVFWLAPVYHVWSTMFINANLFYHLIVPVMSIIAFLFFQAENRIKFFETLYGIVPMFVYSIAYMIQLYVSGNPTILGEDGNEIWPNDWYGFAHIKVGEDYLNFFVVFLIILVFQYLVALALWALNALSRHFFFGFLNDEGEELDIAKDDKEEALELSSTKKEIKDEPTSEEEKETETKVEETPAEGKKEEKVEETTSSEEKTEENKPVSKKTVKAKKPASELVQEEKKEEKEDEGIVIPNKPKRATTTSLRTSEINNGRPDNLYKDKSRVYHISKHLSGTWQVRLANGEKAIKTFKTQREAIDFAKALVKSQGGSIRVHSKKGILRKAH